MAMLRDIGHNMETFKYLSKPQQNNASQPQKGFQKGNGNPNPNTRKTRGRKEISTDRKEKSVELKGIPDDIIAERNNADMCLKCGKGPHKWYECWAKAPVTTRTVPKKKGIPQVRDTSKKEKKKEVKISAVGMEDEDGGTIIELVTDSDGEYELLR